MPSFPVPRKQRTRQHVIADLGVHHVQRFILEEGHTAQQSSNDYGYDLIMTTFDGHGFIEPGVIYFQVKAMETLAAHGTRHANFLYDLEIRDYNLWRNERPPVVLVLFDALRRRAYWLVIQQYFNQQGIGLPKKGARTVRVRVPVKQVVNRRAIVKLRELKKTAVDRGWVEATE